jgi:hypothetical protein
VKVDVACLFRTVSVPVYTVSVWKDIFSEHFRLKLGHEWKGLGFGMALEFRMNDNHTTFCSNRD